MIFRIFTLKFVLHKNNIERNSFTSPSLPCRSTMNFLKTRLRLLVLLLLLPLVLLLLVLLLLLLLRLLLLSLLLRLLLRLFLLLQLLLLISLLLLLLFPRLDLQLSLFPISTTKPGRPLSNCQ